MNAISRCAWPKSERDIRYHDTEWGVPLHDDKKLFEFLILDTFQAGLSWAIILQKREGFRGAFCNFDVAKVAQMNAEDAAKLVKNSEIIRNPLKIAAAISNAQCFLDVQREFGSFDKYIWQFTDFKTIDHKLAQDSDAPTTNDNSDAMSTDMKSRGFKFVGSTTCYAFMQAAGMVNDHMVDCFRYKEVKNQK